MDIASRGGGNVRPRPAPEVMHSEHTGSTGGNTNKMLLRQRGRVANVCSMTTRGNKALDICYSASLLFQCQCMKKSELDR